MSHPPILEPLDAYALWAPGYPAHAHNPVMKAEERAMLARMPDSLKGRSVLDAGCGSGRYMRHVLSRGASRVLGVDFSPPMLECAAGSVAVHRRDDHVMLVRGELTAMPVADAWADLTVCGLVVGHLENLDPVLTELRRVTRRGGTILCSDVHPIGCALGWLRDFRRDGRRYAVRHTPHAFSRWHALCAALDLRIERVLEPMLDPADIPDGANFDRAALDIPVALVFQLTRLS